MCILNSETVFELEDLFEILLLICELIQKLVDETARSSCLVHRISPNSLFRSSFETEINRQINAYENTRHDLLSYAFVNVNFNAGINYLANIFEERISFIFDKRKG